MMHKQNLRSITRLKDEYNYYQEQAVKARKEGQIIISMKYMSKAQKAKEKLEEIEC